MAILSIWEAHFPRSAAAEGARRLISHRPESRRCTTSAARGLRCPRQESDLTGDMGRREPRGPSSPTSRARREIGSASPEPPTARSSSGAIPESTRSRSRRSRHLTDRRGRGRTRPEPGRSATGSPTSLGRALPTNGPSACRTNGGHRSSVDRSCKRRKDIAAALEWSRGRSARGTGVRRERRPVPGGDQVQSGDRQHP
jgi:hypothetical protein